MIKTNHQASVEELETLLIAVRDEVEMAEKRLITICDQVNVGHRQGGGREFARQIDAQFREIWRVLGKS